MQDRTSTPRYLIPPRADFIPFDTFEGVVAWIDTLPADQKLGLLLHAFLPDSFPFGDC